jgi:excinuclease ABC subunit C
LEEFLPNYYLQTSDKPKEILLPAKINEKNSSLLPKIFVPQRGPKLKLIKLGVENAKQFLENNLDKNLLEEARLMTSLKELQRVLDLKKLPGRIEAYDISNIQGTNPVGSMVVFDFARPKKQDYRKFKIRNKQTPDDFAMMHEMLERRFKNSRSKTWPLPDLVLIDGGKGQLNTALKIIPDNIPTIGLAKREEEIFLPQRSSPLILPTNSPALFLLQRIRDEAHRFAITFHRRLRSQSLLRSSLDSIPGIGPEKKKKLLTKFGSIPTLKSANLTELSNVVGRRLAEKIKAKL